MSYHLAHALTQAAAGLTVLAIAILPAVLAAVFSRKPAQDEHWPEGWHYTDGLDPDDQY